MRIAFLAWHGSPHTRRWVRFFAARGHEVHVVSCGDPTDGSGHVGSENGYVVHELGPLRGGKLGYLLKIPRARRLVRSLRPDVLHAHYATSYGLLALATGVRPLIVTSHGSDLLVSGQSFALTPIVARVLRAADLITVPGEHMRQAAKRLAAPRAPRILVFQYGVEVERLAALGAAARQARTAVQREVRLVSARPLLRLYHTDEIVRAVAILTVRGVDCIYDVAGAGPERRRLEELANDLDIADRVRFHGQLPERATEELIASSDVYVSASDSDGTSIALLEALALGTLPVVSDIASNRPWVADAVNGALVPIAAEAIALGVERVLTLDTQSVRERNLALVGRYADRETNLLALEAMIEELVENARTHSPSQQMVGRP